MPSQDGAAQGFWVSVPGQEEKLSGQLVASRFGFKPKNVFVVAAESQGQDVWFAHGLC